MTEKDIFLLNKKVYKFVQENQNCGCEFTPVHSDMIMTGIIIGTRITEGHYAYTYVQVYSPDEGVLYDVEIEQVGKVGQEIDLGLLVDSSL